MNDVEFVIVPPRKYSTDFAYKNVKEVSQLLVSLIYCKKSSQEDAEVKRVSAR